MVSKCVCRSCRPTLAWLLKEKKGGEGPKLKISNEKLNDMKSTIQHVMAH